MNAKIFIKTKTKQINRIGALNRIDRTLFTNNRDRKWRMSVLGFFQCLRENHLLQTGHLSYSQVTLVRGGKIPSSGGVWFMTREKKRSNKWKYLLQGRVQGNLFLVGRAPLTRGLARANTFYRWIPFFRWGLRSFGVTKKILATPRVVHG